MIDDGAFSFLSSIKRTGAKMEIATGNQPAKVKPKRQFR
jgi:hypothetical protein